jgi:DnaJ-class molecular chaperone
MSEPCKPCNGAGMQRDREGLLRRCPECHGTGVWEKPETKTDRPHTPIAATTTIRTGNRPPCDGMVFSGPIDYRFPILGNK